MKLLDKSYFRYVLWLLLVLNIYWMAKVFPDHQQKLKKATGNTDVLDTRPGYTPDEAYDYINVLGMEGRIIVRRMYLYEDMVYPLIYGLLYFFATTYFLQKAFPKFGALLLLSLFSVAAMIIDYGENFHIVRLLDTFPERNDRLASVASKLTSLKWGTYIIALGLTLISFLAFLLKRFVFIKKNT